MSTTNDSSKGLQSDLSHDPYKKASEKLTMAAESVKQTALECGNHYVAEPAKDLIGLLKDYAGSRPEVAAVWCFGLGLLIGWKLRP